MTLVNRPMIQSFGDREIQLLWPRRVSRRLPRDIQGVALRKLYVTQRSRSLNDLRVTAVKQGMFPVSFLIGERLELFRNIKALPGWAYFPKR